MLLKFSKVFIIIADANVEILEENKELRGIYFFTEEMRSNFTKFPEIVFVDGTYKLFQAGFILMLIVIEDGSGRTKFAGVGILSNETRTVIEWFFTYFKNSNAAACDNIKGFMTDKDLLERDLISQIFQRVPLFICQFYVLKVFSREVNCQKMSITNEKRIESLKIIDKTVKGENEDTYNKWYNKFVEVVPELVQTCFNKTWAPIKQEWTKYSIFQGNCGNLLEVVERLIKKHF